MDEKKERWSDEIDIPEDEKMPPEAADPNATPYDQIDDQTLAETWVMRERAISGRTSREPFDRQQREILEMICRELGAPQAFARAMNRWYEAEEERKRQEERRVRNFMEQGGGLG